MERIWSGSGEHVKRIWSGSEVDLKRIQIQRRLGHVPNSAQEPSAMWVEISFMLVEMKNYPTTNQYCRDTNKEPIHIYTLQLYMTFLHSTNLHSHTQNLHDTKLNVHKHLHYTKLNVHKHNLHHTNRCG